MFLFFYEDCFIVNASYYDRGFLVEQAFYRLHLYDFSIDFGIAYLCQAGDADACIAYLAAVVDALVYFGGDVFF